MSDMNLSKMKESSENQDINKVPVDSCKRWISVLWFISAAVLFLVLIVQTIFGHYHGHNSEAWGWFLPTIMPTLSLIISVLALDAIGQSVKRKYVDKFFFRLAIILSVVYLFLVALTIFVQPITQLSPFELMNLSNLWLGPIQGLVAASMGVLFIKKEPEDSHKGSEEKA